MRARLEWVGTELEHWWPLNLFVVEVVAQERHCTQAEEGAWSVQTQRMLQGVFELSLYSGGQTSASHRNS